MASLDHIGCRANDLLLVLQTVGVELQDVEAVATRDDGRLLRDDLGLAVLRPGAAELIVGLDPALRERFVRLAD